MPDARENNPQAPIVNREQLKELVKQDLSQTERLILISYYITRMNEHEIASALDLTADKVQQSLEQMKAKIREMCCEYKTLKVA